MNTERPSARLPPTIAALLDAAGGTSAALKALLILGADAAGLDVSAAIREARRLRWAGIDEGAAQALEALLAGPSHPRPEVEHIPPAAPRATVDEPGSIYGIGAEV